MAAPDQQNASDSFQRPQVRCPACGALVYLPAVVCPFCQGDMRTGERPKKGFFEEDPEVLRETAKAWLKKAVKIGSALVVVGVAAFIIIKDPFKLRPDLYERLAMAHPSLIRPYVAVHKANMLGLDPQKSKGYHHYLVKELYKKGPLDQSDQAAIKQFLKMTPAQRARLLVDVFRTVNSQRSLWGSYARRRFGGSWAVFVRPAFDDFGRPNDFKITLFVLIDDPRYPTGNALSIDPLNDSATERR